jgi:hypothetical protein
MDDVELFVAAKISIQPFSISGSIVLSAIRDFWVMFLFQMDLYGPYKA